MAGGWRLGKKWPTRRVYTRVRQSEMINRGIPIDSSRDFSRKIVVFIGFSRDTRGPTRVYACVRRNFWRGPSGCGEGSRKAGVCDGALRGWLVGRGLGWASGVGTVGAVNCPRRCVMTQANQDGEFSGAPGPIQPPPHELTAVEQARLERRLNPADPEDTIEAARAREGSRT